MRSYYNHCQVKAEASHGIDSKRLVRTDFLFLSFNTHYCSSQKPFWPIYNSQLSQRIATQLNLYLELHQFFEMPLRLITADKTKVHTIWYFKIDLPNKALLGRPPLIK